MLPPLREALATRAVLFDGGMGTEIYARGVFLNRCYEELNLVRPAIVEEVHRAFLQAGAEAVETNTFAACRPRLEPHGLGERVAEINRTAARLARAAVGQRAWVTGAVGPLGIRLEPWGPTTFDEAVALFEEQLAGLADGGVDAFVFETFTDLVEVQAAVEAARRTADIPVVAMMTVDEQGRTPEGVPPEWMAQKLEASGADVIGVNCSVGPAPMLSVLETLAGIATLPLAAMPNAGIPRSVEGRMLYLTSPAYMSRYAKRFAKLGARVIGGCCGVTPEHVRAMREALGQRGEGAVIPRLLVPPPRATPATPVPRREKSALGRKIDEGRFVALLEVSPPRGWETSELFSQLEPWLAAGLDGVLVRDDPRSTARLSPVALARLVAELDGVRARGASSLLELTCKNRDLLSLQSELLGVHALGLRDLVLVTGQEPGVGEVSWSADRFDVDAIGATNVAFRLNHGLDVGDVAIGAPTAFHTGVLLTVGAVAPEEEQRRFEWKVDAGAEYTLTSPIFDVEALRGMLERIAPVRIPVFACLRVLGSLREAEFLAEEVPGVSLPKSLLERMGAAAEAGREAEEGRAIAVELLEAIADDVDGVLVSGAAALAPELARELGAFVQARAPRTREFPGRPGIRGGSEATRYDS